MEEANQLVRKLESCVEKGQELIKRLKSVTQIEIPNIENLSFEEVCRHFANGAIHAKDVPEEGAENFGLYNTIRRLKSNKSKLHWHFCTKCGRVLHFNTRTHYNQLKRHFENECVGQLIGDGNSISVCTVAVSYISILFTFQTKYT